MAYAGLGDTKETMRMPMCLGKQAGNRLEAEGVIKAS